MSYSNTDYSDNEFPDIQSDGSIDPWSPSNTDPMGGGAPGSGIPPGEGTGDSPDWPHGPYGEGGGSTPDGGYGNTIHDIISIIKGAIPSPQTTQPSNPTHAPAPAKKGIFGGVDTKTLIILGAIGFAAIYFLKSK